jgi:hypothetical protein
LHPDKSVRALARPAALALAWTALLIFGELLCWGVFGVYRSDPRLIVLGATGVAASLLVLARVAGPPSAGRGGPRPASTRVRSAV